MSGGNQVTQSDLHDLTLQLKDLVGEVRQWTAQTKDLKNEVDEHGKRIRDLELTQAENKSTFEDIKTVKRYIIAAVVTFIGSAGSLAYYIGKVAG